MKKYQVCFRHLRFLTLFCHVLWVTTSQSRRCVSFAPRPPRMLPRRATLNVLTHFSTPWICMWTKTSVELQWRHPVFRVYNTCISMCPNHCKYFLILTVSVSVFSATGGCVFVSELQQQYPTCSTWYYVSSVSQTPTSEVQNEGVVIAFHFVYS